MSDVLPHHNPLPQLTPSRIRKLQSLVAERVWERVESLSVLRSGEQLQMIDCRRAESLPLQPLEPGERFGRGGDHWTTHWMRIEIPEPIESEQGRRYLRWKCQGETTVWIEGRPWAGLDLGHPVCPLPDTACSVWLECCNWQTGIWISMSESQGIGPHGLAFEGAELAVRDPVAWACHCDLDAIVQVTDAALRGEPDLKLAKSFGYCRALESCTPRVRRLLAELDKLCDLWQDTGNVSVFATACKDLLTRWPAECWQPLAAVCGHAHIDLVWLWPEAATRKKVVHSIATVLRLLERDPDFVFVQSMPALYRMLEEDAPDLMADVSAHIASGRWEVVGGFEVEPDTNLPGGEALVRSLIIGQKKIAQLTGKPSEIAWIPDVFGYNQCLPQILALGGVRYFYTTKMTWSNITKFPCTSFVWRAADGSEVLAHLGTTDYNGEVLLAAHEKAFAEHRQAGVHPELLLPTGYGDGGGGPTELHLERARRFANLSGVPRTKWTRADDFFARLEELRDQLPVYQGELYLEYHRGTYTTQSEFKRLYRRAERGLQAHEAVRVALGQGPLAEESWQRLVFAHFHDAIPGSSIGDVYAEMNRELEAIGDREFAAAESELTREGSERMVFNPLPYARVVTVDDDAGVAQVRLPALASAAVRSGDSVVLPVLEASPTTLRHDRLTARFDDRGQLVELSVDGNPLRFDLFPAFVLSPDDPVAFDAWDIDHHAARSGRRVADELTLQVAQRSDVRAILESEPVAIGQSSSLQVRYVLDAGSLHLKIEASIEWQESHRLLRYVIPTAYRGRRARFGCPFGSIERPQLPGTESDEAMWEVPGSRWAAVQDDGGGEGLAILAESKLGYAARDGVLSLSLLRAPKWPDAHADMGSHQIRFAIGRLRLETTEKWLGTSVAADALFSPPLRYHGPPVGDKFRWHTLGSLNASWCGPSASIRGGYFLRLHEVAGQPGTSRLQLHRPVKQATLVDFREETVAELAIDSDGNLEIPYQAWQILTLRIG